VAVDAIGTEVMGFPKESFGMTRLAQTHGIGTYEGTKVQTIGVSFEKMVKQKKKKGMAPIDPRILWFIIALIVLYLLWKSGILAKIFGG
jgi:hypothetical protein